MDWEQRCEVVAVLKEFRTRILKVSHENGGHLGVEKGMQVC